MRKKETLFVSRMCERKLTIALAESMTCGLAAHQLSTTKGTSEVLMGSIVCYNESVKKDLLRVSAKRLEKHTAESMQVTEDLCRNLKKLIKADIHAAITGLASSGGSETKSKPAGTVFFCALFRNNIYREKKLFRGTPLQIRKKASDFLYDFVSAKILLKHSPTQKQ